jgi:hypothetical protein
MRRALALAWSQRPQCERQCGYHQQRRQCSVAWAAVQERWGRGDHAGQDLGILSSPEWRGDGEAAGRSRHFFDDNGTPMDDGDRTRFLQHRRVEGEVRFNGIDERMIDGQSSPKRGSQGRQWVWIWHRERCFDVGEQANCNGGQEGGHKVLHVEELSWNERRASEGSTTWRLWPRDMLARIIPRVEWLRLGCQTACDGSHIGWWYGWRDCGGWWQWQRHQRPVAMLRVCGREKKKGAGDFRAVTDKWVPSGKIKMNSNSKFCSNLVHSKTNILQLKKFE